MAEAYANANECPFIKNISPFGGNEEFKIKYKITSPEEARKVIDYIKKRMSNEYPIDGHFLDMLSGDRYKHEKGKIILHSDDEHSRILLQEEIHNRIYSNVIRSSTKYTPTALISDLANIGTVILSLNIINEALGRVMSPKLTFIADFVFGSIAGIYTQYQYEQRMELERIVVSENKN